MTRVSANHDYARAEVPGVAVPYGDRVELRCWPDKHWIGEVRPDGVLRLWDRRCKKYILFELEELLRLLAACTKHPAA